MGDNGRSGGTFTRRRCGATDDLGHYRRQVERVFNRISLTGLPERDPGLSELPLDRVFISLAVDVRPAIASR
jgi:hypothetical protein